LRSARCRFDGHVTLAPVTSPALALEIVHVYVVAWGNSAERAANRLAIFHDRLTGAYAPQGKLVAEGNGLAQPDCVWARLDDGLRG
jgi:hypothetical protein